MQNEKTYYGGATQVLHHTEQPVEEVKTQTIVPQKSASGNKAAYVVGGVVAGAAAGIAGSAAAMNADEEVLTVEVEEQPTVVTEEQATAEEVNQVEAVVAIPEEIKVAHVDDDASFSEAFAEARAQVGAGGVFEWRGQVYGTYYKEEWESMTPEEQAEYQSRINYGAVLEEGGTQTTSASVNTTTDTLTASVSEEPTINADYVDEDAESAEVKILGVEVVTDADGNQATIAGLEIEGLDAIMVDVDNDGTMDIMGIDVDADGQLSDDEFRGVSDYNIPTEELIELAPDSDNGMGQYDDAGDFMNDVDNCILV